MVFVGIGLQRLHPLVTDCLLPVGSAHKSFHASQHGQESVPAALLMLLLDEDALGSTHTHGGENIEATGLRALGGIVVIVHHLLEHFAIRLVTLGHEVDFVDRRAQVLGFDTCLLLGNLLYLAFDAGKLLLLANKLWKGHGDLLHNLIDLHDVNVVGLAHEEGYWLGNLPVKL